LFPDAALETHRAPAAFGWLPNIAVTLAAIVVMLIAGVPSLSGTTEARRDEDVRV